MILLNPKSHTRHYPDDNTSRDIMRQTIGFFEERGKAKLKADDRDRIWYGEFLDFIKENQIFARLLTPPEYGDEGTRWDTYRNCEFN